MRYWDLLDAFLGYFSCFEGGGALVPAEIGAAGWRRVLNILTFTFQNGKHEVRKNVYQEQFKENTHKTPRLRASSHGVLSKFPAQ